MDQALTRLATCGSMGLRDFRALLRKVHPGLSAEELLSLLENSSACTVICGDFFAWLDAEGTPAGSGISAVRAMTRGPSRLVAPQSPSFPRGSATVTLTELSGAAHGCKFEGLCECAGMVYAAPFSSPRLLRYDPATGEAAIVDVSVAAGQEEQEWKFSGICACSGMLYAAPYRTPRLLVYDPETRKAVGVDVSEVAGQVAEGVPGGMFFGICTCAGKIYAAPGGAPRLLVYDPATGEASGVDVTAAVGDAAEGFKFGGICECEGKVYAVPCNAPRLLVYDPATGEVDGVDVSAAVGKGVQTGMFFGICACAGKLYAAPFDAQSLLVYDPATGKAVGVDVSAAAGEVRGGKFFGICSFAGKLYAAPFAAPRLLVYDPLTGEATGVDIDSNKGLGPGGYKLRGICACSGRLLALDPHSARLLAYEPHPEGRLSDTAAGATRELKELRQAEARLAEESLAFWGRSLEQGEWTRQLQEVERLRRRRGLLAERAAIDEEQRRILRCSPLLPPLEVFPCRLGYQVADALVRGCTARSETERAFPFFFLDAGDVLAWPPDMPLPRFQDLWHAGRLHWETLNIQALFKGECQEEYLAISHRWETPDEPDPKGTQLSAIKAFLSQTPRIKWLWVDFCCLPQGKHLSMDEQRLVGETLNVINHLFLSMSVLVIFDFQYVGRFWTSYEAWLSMQQASSDGLSPATDGSLRFTVQCVGAAERLGEHYAEALRKTWHDRSTEGVIAELSNDDISVTNPHDKDQQLEKLRFLPELVRKTFFEKPPKSAENGMNS